MVACVRSFSMRTSRGGVAGSDLAWGMFGFGVAGGAGFEAAPDELDRGVELRSGVLRGPARHQLTGEIRESLAVRGIEHRAGARKHANDDDRDGRTLAHEQHDAVRQDLAVGAWTRGRRRGGDGEHEDEKDEPRGAVRRHGNGSRMPTFFFVGRKYARATRV